jgi:hypothetical protein
VDIVSDVLRCGECEVRLSRTESRAVALLLERSPAPTTTRELSSVLWPAAPPTEFARRHELVRLRRRLAVVGLVLRLRARIGYTIEASPWVCDGSAVHDVDSLDAASESR